MSKFKFWNLPVIRNIVWFLASLRKKWAPKQEPIVISTQAAMDGLTTTACQCLIIGMATHTPGWKHCECTFKLPMEHLHATQGDTLSVLVSKTCPNYASVLAMPELVTNATIQSDGYVLLELRQI